MKVFEVLAGRGGGGGGGEEGGELGIDVFDFVFAYMNVIFKMVSYFL